MMIHNWNHMLAFLQLMDLIRYYDNQGIMKVCKIIDMLRKF